MDNNDGLKGLMIKKLYNILRNNNQNNNRR